MELASGTFPQPTWILGNSSIAQGLCTQHDPSIPYYSWRSREKRQERISVMWVPLGGWVRSWHQGWFTAYNALFTQTSINERQWQLQQILHINITFVGLGASKGWQGGKAVRHLWKMAALCRTVPLSHPRSADAVTFHVWKGFDILFSSLDLLVPHSSPSNTSEELRAACREWAEEIVKPHHNRTTSHIHHPAPHKMFLMMLFANTFIESQT